MIIREFSTNQFAGINNQMFKFEENLNVVLGPNEAGKSTVVNAIVATLFNKIKVGDRNKEDVIFKERFMPHPSGDNIDGKITIEVAGDKYLLQKE
jgi:exonuclease SbcC